MFKQSTVRHGRVQLKLVLTLGLDLLERCAFVKIIDVQRAEFLLIFFRRLCVPFRSDS